MAAPISDVEVRWLKPAEGGRKKPFCGSRYAATARFSGEEELFSVILQFNQVDQANPVSGKLTLLFPDRADIQTRIAPGSKLEITEGARLVAHCQVVSVRRETIEAGHINNG